MKCKHRFDPKELQKLGIPKVLIAASQRIHELDLCDVEPDRELVERVMKACEPTLQKMKPKK